MDYKYTLSNLEIQILNHDLLDIKDWIDKAIEGKINSCRKRVAMEYRQKAKELGERMVPVSDVDCVTAYFSNPSYMNREQRDLASNLIRLPEIKGL